VASKSRTTPVKLRPGRAHTEADALLTTMTADELTSQLPLTLACANGGLSDEEPGQ
jgi:hypothetical protein